MSVIQSQCAVACSTLPLHIKLFTTAALERGRLASVDWDSYSGSDSRRIPSLRRTTLKNYITSPTSPAGPFIMPLGASAAVVNQSPGEAHITSRRYNMQWWLSFSKINCYLFTSRISHDISPREPEGLFSFCLSRLQCNRTSLSHPQILLKSLYLKHSHIRSTINLVFL